MNISREKRSRYRKILRHAGLLLFIGGVLMLLPPAVLWPWIGDASLALSFIAPAIVLLLLGGVARVAVRDEAAVLTLADGWVITLLGWTAVCLFSAWPFHTAMNLPPTLALFEAVSGWTTTGLSVIDPEKAPAMILVWRSLMQYAGGAGLAVIMVAAIAGPVDAGLVESEGRAERLAPNVQESAKLVLQLYLAYAAAGTGAFFLCGMDFFDAVNHAMTATSTGGFSTKTASIGYWNSWEIEAVAMVLMLLGGFNFLTAHLLFHGRFSSVARNSEVRFLLVLLPVCAGLMFICATLPLFGDTSKALRLSLFETVSGLTTTGFTTVDYRALPQFGVIFLISLMCVGGGTGSTSGGIKQFRAILLMKLLRAELRRAFLPKAAVEEESLGYGERQIYVSPELTRRLAAFIFLYFAALAAGTGVLTLYGYSVGDSLFEFASSLGTVGMSAGITSPEAPAALLWTEMAGMFLGRLEFFVIINALIKIARDLPILCRRAYPASGER